MSEFESSSSGSVVTTTRGFCVLWAPALAAQATSTMPSSTNVKRMDAISRAACAVARMLLYFASWRNTKSRMALDDIFRALGDPTRRKILRLLQRRDMAAGEIASQFPLAASTLSGHFNVLK